MAVKTRTDIPVWQRPADQLKKLTRELRALHSELFRELAEKDQRFRDHSNFAGSGAAADLRELKTAADEIRRVLWLYLEKLPESEPREQADDSHRGDRQHAGQPGSLQMQELDPPAATVPAGSFFERLNLAIEGYMQNRGIRTGDTRTKS